MFLAQNMILMSNPKCKGTSTGRSEVEALTEDRTHRLNPAHPTHAGPQIIRTPVCFDMIGRTPNISQMRIRSRCLQIRPESMLRAAFEYLCRASLKHRTSAVSMTEAKAKHALVSHSRSFASDSFVRDHRADSAISDARGDVNSQWTRK